MPAVAAGYSGQVPAFAAHQWHAYHYWGPVGAAAPMALLFLLALVVAAIRNLVPALRRWLAARRAARAAAAQAQLPLLASDAQHPVLASDAERELVTGHLSAAVGEGRLSLEEGGERVDAALRARHRHELASLVTDLPALAVGPLPHSLAARLRVVGVATLVATAIVLQALVGLWELWPAAVAACATVALRRRAPSSS